MTNKEKLLIAGLGGLTPVLASLLVIDLETLLLHVTPLAIGSYTIRVVTLFGVGVLMGWLHRTERSAIKLFQLGVAGPALITGVLGGVSARVNLSQTLEPAARPAVSTADKEDDNVQSFDSETRYQQVLRGLIGVLPKPVWYIVAGNYFDLDEAKRRTSEMRALGFDAYVYQTYGTGRYYEVVIGAASLEAGAVRLQQSAKSAGVTPLWRFCYNITAYSTCSGAKELN